VHGVYAVIGVMDMLCIQMLHMLYVEAQEADCRMPDQIYASNCALGVTMAMTGWMRNWP
jgi:hypothetical protein